MSEKASKGKSIAESIAAELVSVQPMPSDSIRDLRSASKSEKELRAEGYKPVSRLGLMWTKE